MGVMPTGRAKNSAVFFTFRLGRAGFEPRRADVLACAVIYYRRIWIVGDPKSCHGHGPAQNRRGQTIELLKVPGTPSFSP
jgi:hypothetical protein